MPVYIKRLWLMIQNTQEIKRMLFSWQNRTKRVHFWGSPLSQATHNIKTEKNKQLIQPILCQLDVGGWRKENGLICWHKLQRWHTVAVVAGYCPWYCSQIAACTNLLPSPAGQTSLVQQVERRWKDKRFKSGLVTYKSLLGGHSINVLLNIWMTDCDQPISTRRWDT